MTYVTVQLTEPQVFILRSMLQLEINTNMKMSGRETALQAFKRLTNIDPGRGAKGRQRAIDILDEYERLCRESE